MQLPIPFDQVIETLDALKSARRAWLKKTGAFSDAEISFLIRITYDITDKDFEYFIALLLEADGYTTIVQGGLNDKWTDIIAKKDGKNFAIQCKQWSKSYISMKDAGEYYGTIYYQMQQNPDMIYSFVTTSYVDDRVRWFLEVHHIPGIISNRKIIEESKKLGYFSDIGWRNLIQDIQHKRLMELRKSRQLSMESGFEKLKQDLRTARLQELKHHLPKHMQNRTSSINRLKHKEFLNSFFQYWNLV